jgi:hypothetical protein
MAIYFLIVKYSQKDLTLASAGQISEHWRLTNKQHSRSACYTVCVIRDMMPQDMEDHADDKIMETLYNENDALLDFL